MKKKLAMLLMLGTGLAGCSPASLSPPEAVSTHAPSTIQAKCCLTCISVRGLEQKLPKTLPPDTVTLKLYAEGPRPATVVLAAFEGAQRTFPKRLEAKVMELKGDSPGMLSWPLGSLPAETTVFVAFIADPSADSAAAQKLLQRFGEDPKPDGPPVRKLYQDLTQWYGEHGFGVARKGPDAVTSGVAQTVTARSSNPEEAGRLAKMEPAPRAWQTKPGPLVEESTGGAHVVLFDWQTSADLVQYSDEHAGVLETVISPAN